MDKKELDSKLRQLLVECHDRNSKRSRPINDLEDFIKKHSFRCSDTLMAVCQETFQCLTGRGNYQQLEQQKVQWLCHYVIEKIGYLAAQLKAGTNSNYGKIRRFLFQIYKRYKNHRLIKIRFLAILAKDQLFWSGRGSIPEIIKKIRKNLNQH